MTPKRIAVFCGSSIGKSPIYAAEAKKLASSLAQHELDLVYGGGNVGLMGIIADEMMALGREAIGVIPRKLMEKEVGHKGLTKLHEVESMHDRKALMASLSNGFIAMPGGIGTLEEIIEVFTWQQIGYHEKPCGLLDTNGFYTDLIGFLNHTVAEEFLSRSQFDRMIISADPDTLVRSLFAK